MRQCMGRDACGMTRKEALAVGVIVVAVLAVRLAAQRPVAAPQQPGPADFCLRNMQQLAQALMLYRTEHGELPVDLHDADPESAPCWEKAVEPYVDSSRFPAVLVCPSDPSGGAELQGKCPHPTSYRYLRQPNLPPTQTDDRPDTRPILVCPREHGEGIGAYVARLDGCILVVPPEDVPTAAETPAGAQAPEQPDPADPESADNEGGN